MAGKLNIKVNKRISMTPIILMTENTGLRISINSNSKHSKAIKMTVMYTKDYLRIKKIQA